jgi:hypothetical protein
MRCPQCGAEVRPHSSLGTLTLVEFAQLKAKELIQPPAGENEQRQTLLIN